MSDNSIGLFLPLRKPYKKTCNIILYSDDYNKCPVCIGTEEGITVCN